MGLIDTHFHLDYYKNHSELVKRINDLQQHTICMTSSPGIYNSCKKLYPNYKYIKFALGFHPHNDELRQKDFDEFVFLFRNSNYIGEVGLDFSKEYERNREMQIKYFSKIIEMCSQNNKLVSVHLKNDDGMGIKILERYKPEKCIIHWFNGYYNELKRLIDLGCYFSINENMIHNKVKGKWLAEIPKDKLLVESDGPFTRVNGKRYTPDLLFQEYENIARFLDEPDLITVVYDNFGRILK